MPSRPIYLDYNSTTPMDPRVLEAMQPYFLEKFGNPASQSHLYGWEAEEAVEMAREAIAQAVGAEDKSQIIFTSGATESNNLATKGVARAAGKKIHLITQKTEHKCVLDSCKEMEKEGHDVTYLDVDASGLVDVNQIKKNIRPHTRLCSIMYANNEIGTLQPIREISKICHEHKVLLHSDAVQAVGKIPVDVQKDGIDLMSLSGHKIYGPKGIGALYVGSGISLFPLLHGGGHEKGLRSGTLNVPGIIGMAKALDLCLSERATESKRLTELRNRFILDIQKRLEGVTLNGHSTQRLPNNINLSFEGIQSDDLLLAIPQIAVSSGSACTSGTPEPSYVIRAITNDESRVNSAIRIGLGRGTTENDLQIAHDALVNAVEKLRSQSLKDEIKRRGHSERSRTS